MTKERKKFLIMVAKDCWSSLCGMNEHEQTNEIIDTAMDNDVLAFECIKNESKKTYKRCLRAVKGCTELLDEVPKKFKNKIKKELGL